ncbi:uncharacterized protein EI90DRAFT_3019115 [Cantharellus anzutake]|uniref:uncharacterized protein n=1 Tax=Cantharellus anzutake TaxID=1750568 RepID=UPI0019073A3A|nr:uncharacterized protein EI90DRAFT_3019115 [Cantharellus anzutake]KAF8325317.1 hypothetical protein EI90DRAFT_3019115 [Cantharellus anzutake]
MRACTAVRITFSWAQEIFRQQSLAGGRAAFDDHHDILEVWHAISGRYNTSRGWCHGGARIIPVISKHNVMAYILLVLTVSALVNGPAQRNVAQERSKCLTDQTRVAVHVALPMVNKPQIGHTNAPAREGDGLPANNIAHADMLNQEVDKRERLEDPTGHGRMPTRLPGTPNWWSELQLLNVLLLSGVMTATLTVRHRGHEHSGLRELDERATGWSIWASGNVGSAT